MRPIFALRATFVAVLAFSAAPVAPAQAAPPRKDAATTRPNLVLLLVVDQMRADTLTRFESQFGPSGFARLMKRGAWYPAARYDVLQALTAVGHAIISTGSLPYANGIPSNGWYEIEKRSRMYCTEDAEAAIVPAELNYRGAGTSTRNLNGSTFGDELKNAGHPSRVVAIAQKDRSAILLGGHRADLALWMDDKKDTWVSSRFYRPDGTLPSWVVTLNAEIPKFKATLPRLTAKGPGGGMSLIEQPGQKRSDEFLNEAFAKVALTGVAAEKALDAYSLGKGKATDVLAVSLSAHDYVAHEMGHNSRELEEMTLAEDRAIARLLAAVDRKVPGGLARTLVVLTADHGGPPSWQWMKESRIDAGNIPYKEVAAQLEAHLKDKLGAPKGGSWLAYSDYLNYTFNREALADKGIERQAVEELAKSFLAKVKGVFRVFSHTDVIRRTLPPGQFERQILKTFYPGRSSDVIVIPKPFYMSTTGYTTHQTGYSYDTTVPIILAGPGIRPGRYAAQADVTDIAPTISYLLGVLPPALSEGRILSEAIAGAK